MTPGLSLSDAVIPAYRRGLDGIARMAADLSMRLREDQAAEAALMIATISPGFPSLSAHMHGACVHAYADVSRALGREPDAWPAPLDFSGLVREAQQSMSFLNGLDVSDFRHAPGITVVEDEDKATWRGDQYLLLHSLPHFYFHVSSTLFILKRRGIDMGEPDFLWSGSDERAAA